MSNLKPLFTPQTYYVCHGSDCRKKKEDWARLNASLGKQGTVCPVKCQKICKGPVVGMEIDGRIEWFSKLKKKALQDQLLLVTRTGDLSKRLRARLSKKRRGKLRGPTKNRAPSRAA